MTELLDKPTKTAEFYFGLGFFISLLIVLMYAVVQLIAWLEDEQQAPVQDIVVSGERRFIQDQQIEQLIRATQPGSFFELDVNLAHQSVEAMPWVYRASIRKRWPNSLDIFVVEQQPAAIWNGDMLLNQYGEAFDGKLETSKQSASLQLPNLYGPGGSEQTALQGYRNMQSLLEATELQIVEMFLSERFAWNLELDNGIKLNLGRTEFIDRLQRFVDLLPLISKQDKPIDYVDLRYDTGLAVGWKTADKAA